MNRSKEQALAVLFADVCDSTGLYERLGDAVAFATLEGCLAALREQTLRQGGRVVKTIGDEIMAVFNEAGAAFEAACQMQQAVELLAPPEDAKLAIRVGFQFGPTLVEGDDVFGDTVNTAARLAQMAKGGQIITSGDVLVVLPLMHREMTRDLDAYTVRGKTGELRLYEVIWHKPEELTMRLATVTPIAPPASRLWLKLRGRELTMERNRQRLTLGRDAACDLVLEDQLASRTHARIERRRDKFALIDHSTNGTYLTFTGEPEIALKREEILLRGSGRVCFGHPGARNAEALEFRLD